MRLIDADALLDKATEIWGTEAGEDETNVFMDMIYDAPTIDPVTHARWIIHKYPDGGTYLTCSNCGYKDETSYECSECGNKVDWPMKVCNVCTNEMEIEL